MVRGTHVIFKIFPCASKRLKKINSEMNYVTHTNWKSHMAIMFHFISQCLNFLRLPTTRSTVSNKTGI